MTPAKPEPGAREVAEAWLARGVVDEAKQIARAFLAEQDRRIAAEEALRKYGRHLEECDLNEDWMPLEEPVSCTCGLHALSGGSGGE